MTVLLSEMFLFGLELHVITALFNMSSYAHFKCNSKLWLSTRPIVDKSKVVRPEVGVMYVWMGLDIGVS